MFCYPKNTYVFPERKSKWYQLYFLIALPLIIYLISGCNSTSSKQFFEISEFGISLEKPDNWNLVFYERSGVIVLETEYRTGTKGSARIEIHGNACFPTPSWLNSSDEEIKSNIDRIRILYNLHSVTIFQEPIRVKTGNPEVTEAIITIPTISMPENSAENQVGIRDPNVFQTIDMYAIRDSDKAIMAYIYKGNSEILNVQAQEIINSIQLTCLTEP